MRICQDRSKVQTGAAERKELQLVEKRSLGLAGVEMGREAASEDGLAREMAV